MHETYTIVGNDCSWVNAVMPIPALAVLLLQRWRKGRKPLAPWWIWGTALYFFIGSIVGVPMEWLIGGACILAAAAILFNKSLPVKIYVRGIFALLFFGLSIPFFAMSRIGYTQIVLRDSDLSYRELGRDSTGAKAGLRVDETGPNKEFFNIRSWGSWDIYPGKLDNGEDLHIIGFSYYWGPQGLIRGDALGERIARWGGVKPRVRSESELSALRYGRR